MPVYALPAEHVFPDPRRASESGLLAVGGDLHPDRLLLAYALGIFPWYSEGQPILWHSPDPRFVLEPASLRIPRSLRQVARRRPYRLTLDTAFPAVIAACADADRPGQAGTWITDEMQGAYTELAGRGLAHSVEAWDGDALVGGLYGVALGGIFFGESMFARAPDASKVAFVALVRQLQRWDFGLIDSQVRTAHVARFGGVDIPRSDYLRRLAALRSAPAAAWRWDGDPYVAFDAR